MIQNRRGCGVDHAGERCSLCLWDSQASSFSDEVTLSSNLKIKRRRAKWSVGSNLIDSKRFKSINVLNMEHGSLCFRGSYAQYFTKLPLCNFLVYPTKCTTGMCLEPMSHNLVIYSAFLTYDRSIIAGVAVLENMLIFAVW